MQVASFEVKGYMKPDAGLMDIDIHENYALDKDGKKL
jgi:hypothetical protein